MKKLRTVSLLLLLLVAFTLTACRGGEIDAPEYDPLSEGKPQLAFTLLDNGTYSVNKGTLSGAKDIVIPDTYNGKPVTAIDASGFSGCVFDSITIPNSITTIGAGAFSGCGSVKSITLPSALTAIPASAFSNCIHLEEVVIPTSVASIGAGAFEGCVSMTTISLHEGLTSIGAKAFYNCKLLATVSLPSSLCWVGGDAFAVLGQETFTEENDLIYNELNGDLYLGNAQNPYVVLIRVGNRAVTSYTLNPDTRVIYGSALSRASIAEITLHEGLKGIGPYALNACGTLQTIHIPDSVLTLGEGALQSCSGLTSITGMKNVTTLGDYAFAYCRSLSSLTLSEVLTDVGIGVFSGTSALATTNEGSLSYIGSASNPHMILLKATDRTKTSFDIHPDTKIIYQGAFQSCTKLTRIAVPEGVLTLGNSAFSGCEVLTYVTLPSTLETVGISAFRNCKQLFDIVVPENVTYIGSGAFSGCSLSKITLPFVGEYASGSGNVLFGHIFGITDSAQHISKIPKSLTTVIITNCTSLGVGAFIECTTITSLTLPATLKIIGSGAFYLTKNLKKLYINDLAAWCAVEIPSVTETPMYYGASLYLNGKKLEETIIPEGVPEIKQYTFYNCQSITTLKIPGTVQKICDSAFEGCSLLNAVSIGEGTETIGCAVFKDCKALVSVTLPDTVSLIDSNAFRSCVLLEEIRLPKSLTFLADHVFKNCDSLQKVTFAAKSGWYLCETRLLLNPEKISVWQSKKNAERLTGDDVTLYVVRAK